MLGKERNFLTGGLSPKYVDRDFKSCRKVALVNQYLSSMLTMLFGHTVTVLVSCSIGPTYKI